MKKLFSLLSIIVGVHSCIPGIDNRAYAATIPQASSVVTSGGATNSTAPSASGITTPLANIDTIGAVLLCAGNTALTASNFYGLYSLQASTNSNYQVPSGKVFYVTDVYGSGTNQNNNARFIACFSPLGSENTATICPTGAGGAPVTYGNVAAGSSGALPFGSVTMSFGGLGIKFAALSYPVVQVQGTAANFNFCVRGIVK